MDVHSWSDHLKAKSVVDPTWNHYSLDLLKRKGKVSRPTSYCKVTF